MGVYLFYFPRFQIARGTDPTTASSPDQEPESKETYLILTTTESSEGARQLIKQM